GILRTNKKLNINLLLPATREEAYERKKVMGKLGVGVSGPAVKTVQQKLNEAYKGSVVAETGEFDENTAGAVARFQATASLPQSGAVDDATLKALFWAAKDKREIKYNGKSYYIGYPDEYNLLSAKLIKKAEAQTTYYLNMAKGVRGMWDAHRDARNNNKFFAFIVDEATGVKFPAESVITAAENGAKSIVGAAKSNDYKAFQDALESGSKAIRQANADMNQYRDELYSGSEKLIEELNDIKEGCVVTLEIS